MFFWPTDALQVNLLSGNIKFTDRQINSTLAHIYPLSNFTYKKVNFMQIKYFCSFCNESDGLLPVRNNKK